MASSSGTMKRSFTSVSILPDNSNQQDAIRIFKIDPEKGKMIFYEDPLKLLLKNSKIKKYKVCVISVNGSYRTGKSFLLNFFLHFLKKKCQSVEQEWMDVNDTLTREFYWRKSWQRVTDGILICPEIFLTETKEGEKIAIILMDTQGTSDHQTSYDEGTKIFALSALISSVHIYNIQNRLDFEQLGVLQLFTGYGAMFSDSEKKPFQDLVILIRDWVNHEAYGFGFEGGENLLISTFKEHEKSNSREIQKTIRDNFANVQCFLMPRPGSKVETKEFKGDFNKIKKIFRDHVKTFVENILTPENLVPKKINNKFVTVEELFEFIRGYWSCINEKDELCIESVYMTAIKISLQDLVNGKVEEYKKRLGSCTDQTQANDEKSEILKEFENEREMKLGSKELLESFKKQLAETLDKMYDDFRVLFNHENQLKKDYFTVVKECKTAEEAQEMIKTRLEIFEKENLNCNRELRDLFKQRLNATLDKMYDDFCVLFNHGNQLKDDYSTVVKECKSVEEAQEMIKTRLEIFEKENVNCNRELRDHFKQRLNATLDKMYDDFCVLFNHGNQLKDDYSTVVKECKSVEEAQEMIKTRLEIFEKENVNCNRELGDHFKQRLNATLDKKYDGFCVLFNHGNQLKDDYSTVVKECKSVEEAQEMIKTRLEIFEKENVNCNRELGDHFKQRLNATLDKMYNDFCVLFNHGNQLKDDYSTVVKECKSVEEAQEMIKTRLEIFEKENVNCNRELRDHFRQRLKETLDKMYDDFCVLFNHGNQLKKDYSIVIKECKTVAEAQEMIKTKLEIFEKENVNCNRELRDHFKQRLNATLDKMYDDFCVLFNHGKQLKDDYSTVVKECKSVEEAQEMIKTRLEIFEKENVHCNRELGDHFKQHLNATLDKKYDDFCVLFNHGNQLKDDYSTVVKECKSVEEAQEMIKTRLEIFEKENVNCNRELRDHSKQRLKETLDKMYDDFCVLFNHENQLKKDYSTVVKECKTIEEAQEMIKTRLEIFEKENVNCNRELRDHFKQRLNATLDKKYDDFCVLFNHGNQLKKDYSTVVKECKTIEEAQEMIKTRLEIFEKENVNCNMELRDHFKQRLNATLDKKYDDFCVLFNHGNQLKDDYSTVVKECKSVEEAQEMIKTRLEIFEKENMNCNRELRDHFKQRLKEFLSDVLEKFRMTDYLKKQYSMLINECSTLKEADEKLERILLEFERNNLNCEDELRNTLKIHLMEECFKIYKRSKEKIEMKHVDYVSNNIEHWAGTSLGVLGAVAGGVVGGPIMSLVLFGAGKSVGGGLGLISRGVGAFAVKLRNYNNEAEEE
ncbi:centromere protein F-like isoform X2 [Zophobas morio]|uniref:centromere protein F-like isoform X2 n=1 Tax=Zophobas morio TaxID=2755281 RepID=UPI003082AF82